LVNRHARRLAADRQIGQSFSATNGSICFEQSRVPHFAGDSFIFIF
jgi:hypothetical protein